MLPTVLLQRYGGVVLENPFILEVDMLWAVTLDEEEAFLLREAFFESVLSTFRKFELHDTLRAECCFELLRRNILNGEHKTVQKETIRLFVERTSSCIEPFYLEGDVYARFLDEVKSNFLTHQVRRNLIEHVPLWQKRLDEIFDIFLSCRHLYSSV